MEEDNEKYHHISKQTDLEDLIKTIDKGILIAKKFKFDRRDLFIKLLESLKVDYENFSNTYYYFDKSRNLHISESEFDYVWISTYGLIANDKPSNNRAINSCLTQYLVISLLFEEAIKITNDDRVYDIDSYSSARLNELSSAIFHNLTFYIEVFCKAYLSLTNTKSPHSHSLSFLYNKTVSTMVDNNHNDSLFQILVLDPLYKFVDHIRTIPGNFKEQFIKYDDNPLDDTVILFDQAGLIEMKIILELSIDFITSYLYEGTKTYYLESNVYQRMLDKADTEEKKKKIREMYPHLANKKEK